jgi:hypothetical protein
MTPYMSNILWGFLKDQGCFLSYHIVWSDGCSGQFKSSRAWYFVARYPSQTRSPVLPHGCQMPWNYFATGHGKWEVDGAGALFKREVRKEQIKLDATKLQNTTEVVAFFKVETLKKFLAGQPKAGRQIRKHLWEIKIGAIDQSRLQICSIVRGSRGMH